MRYEIKIKLKFGAFETICLCPWSVIQCFNKIWY